LFKTVSLDFNGFKGCQNAKTVNDTITPFKLSTLPTFILPYSSSISGQSCPTAYGREVPVSSN